ncbi:MAG: hypothetical protein NTZ09_08725, partial [Candidatus Hydrogenedentes bacterium]|nr:hypothetical protein [Candidatus Hydrogenedentota bacterium]
MDQTLKLLENAMPALSGTIRVPAYATQECEYFIIVDVNDVYLTDVWASNIFQHTGTSAEAIIHVSPELMFQSKADQKLILAHEWIEVMMAFRDPEERRTCVTAGKEPMAQLFEALRQPPIWQDSEE